MPKKAPMPTSSRPVTLAEIRGGIEALGITQTWLASQILRPDGSGPIRQSAIGTMLADMYPMPRLREDVWHVITVMAEAGKKIGPGEYIESQEQYELLGYPDAPPEFPHPEVSWHRAARFRANYRL